MFYEGSKKAMEANAVLHFVHQFNFDT